MNIVTPILPVSKFRWTGKIEDLIGGNFKEKRSAFFGSCGAGEEALYLITYKAISLAGKPGSTWDYNSCDVEVIRFVDVNISVVERKDR